MDGGYCSDNNMMRARNRETEQINMAANLVRCYEMVPRQYFDQQFIFNFEYLLREKSAILKVQEEVRIFWVLKLLIRYF